MELGLAHPLSLWEVWEDQHPEALLDPSCIQQRAPKNKERELSFICSWRCPDVKVFEPGEAD